MEVIFSSCCIHQLLMKTGRKQERDYKALSLMLAEAKGRRQGVTVPSIQNAAARSLGQEGDVWERWAAPGLPPRDGGQLSMSQSPLL